ncbi:MAG: RidA family protein [Spirochaetes bacterium]|nr:RidA family protein [Spirochaetota bacterium]
MKEIIKTDKAPQAIGPYSQATKLGNMVFTSGQLPIDPSTGKFVEGGIKEQTRQALKNMEAVLTAAGSDFSHVVKSLVFLDDMGNFGAFNEVYAEFFKENPPARSCIQAAKLPLGAMVEMEVIAEVK